MSPQQAVTLIGGQGWATTDAGIHKKFEFADYKYTSNFLMRYSAYCTKVGQFPQWSNVYNTVEVTISNPEAEGHVSTREVELAKYLDMLSTVHITDATNIDAHLSFEHIIDIGQIGVSSAVNNQDVRTSLAANDGGEILKLQ